MVSAIIVAAGSSRRMGFDKLFAPLAGKPVLWHSIKAFNDTKEVDEILIVTKDDRMDEVEDLVSKSGLVKVKKVISGGAERHISVWNGLQAVDSQGSEYIAIHDGARPLVTPKLIKACLDLAETHGAATCASQIPDTVKRANIEQMVTESVERTGLWAMQTPQVFSSGLILQAYAALMAKHEMVTDEVSAVQKMGKKIALLKNDDWNMKVTFPHDLELAEHVLALREKKTAKSTKPRAIPR
ncbi:2-C-methyl-D-erythritol 4-phosphate cytidylyltransferase [Chthoniobacter flavus Ellin428]|uniref:2-C-methyl-D-erythritol 4-phosphate cytidylyltransferase n=1 Tax=Chthoniobacter flavus Ellin428 TaxID=497964 RepID=B4D703_9BACT|nr:2-C-methyl-D-erythritol 4-phosphate cytidylyltransferase [Chthoniobacter flavus]EDY17654.1 2-C-methyl-D-erythritol 4-phosphate cytidylyltransferase [Chthoniobacter flavus Ellin428]TCO84073.1 2-C-methyl-D-erythritol 4-phosphate cytidylyltransferase [Chthoniobacter flavus]